MYICIYILGSLCLVGKTGKSLIFFIYKCNLKSTKSGKSLIFFIYKCLLVIRVP